MVNFDGSRARPWTKINKALIGKRIIGGKDLSKEFPELGQSALYCVTEMKTHEDIQTLGSARSRRSSEVWEETRRPC